MQSLAPLVAPVAGQIAVVGSGIAGLMTALELAPRPVVLVTRADLGRESSSLWAQGGIAASLGPEDDPEQHVDDTLRAGAGLCDPEAVRGILSQARDAIETLERYGVRFDRNADGSYALGLEAAHGRHRILHAGGDGSGAAITEALVKAVLNTPSITCLTGVEARRVCVTDGGVSGLWLQSGDEAMILPTSQVVLATGGLGGLYDATTNPRGNVGQGVMMAARAGAVLTDLEFVQFHPTALDVPRTPLALVSEAVRGAGAWLINGAGERFMADTPGAELAPRDVVARAIHAQIARGERVYLDATRAIGEDFAAKFPIIHQFCREAGIDPARAPIPVRPAAHYYMGGIATDLRGRTTVPGLWAVGECACTGLHGANRLASNSLLEAVVMGRRAARDIYETARPMSQTEPSRAAPQMLPKAEADDIRPIVSQYLGMIRDRAGIEAALRALRPLAMGNGPGADAAIVALGIACFAALRTESRGGHARSDFPEPEAVSTRRRMTLDDIFTASGTLLAPASQPLPETLT
ncbi:L-aspartate oxidase [Celeribacter persicus]|uniref:L-aspartate oxidase n=1 Tax=Celeribacter persicus TaxID=1651082 RepID=A0A2T5H9P0_9RHOB|nr:L-aspartate oxidase [Celeribacter persicus]PTQ68300.1 L-aspartate oxidase [Celeribacter persicus]